MVTGFLKNPEGTIYAPGIKARDIATTARTAQGVASGEITDSELTVLKEMRGEAVDTLTQAKGNDGRVDLEERVALHQDINNISKTINTLKHN